MDPPAGVDTLTSRQWARWVRAARRGCRPRSSMRCPWLRARCAASATRCSR